MPNYSIAGLNVESDVVFSDAFAVPPAANGEADVRIVVGHSIGAPERPALSTPVVVAGERDFLFRPSEGLAFRVRDGRLIEIERAPGIADAEVRLFLVGSAWGVLCHQRGLLPIHCSAVSYRRHTFAFTGHSGAGKSTLAAGLAQSGCAHICDDVGIVDTARPGMPMVPMPKGLKLWGEAADRLKIARGETVSDRPDLDKYYVSRGGEPMTDAAPVTALYILDGDAANEGLSISEIHGSARFREVCRSIYRVDLLGVIRDEKAAFLQIAKFASALRVFAFRRPKSWDRFGDGLALLRAHMEQLSGQDQDTEARLAP